MHLAGVLSSLSLACDLANGFPLEKALRNCLVAVGLGRALGFEGRELSDAYYVGLLRSIGCTSFAFEESTFNGDDIDFRNTFAAVDFSRPREVVGRAVSRLGKGSSPLSRGAAVAKFLQKGPKFGAAMAAANCEAGARLAERLGMSGEVVEGLLNIYERWDGKGVPRGLSGDEIPRTALIGNLAHVISVVHRPGGAEGTLGVVESRKGAEFEPGMADAFLREGPGILAEIEKDSVWDATLEAEPEPRLSWARSRLVEVAGAFGDFADLKSPYMLGHSAGVADLAGRAGEIMGLSATEIESLRVAGLVHDLGRVSVPNGTWDKPSALTVPEWERVRLHPYYTERCLAQSLLKPYGSIAALHHERLDESGYHRGFPAALLPAPARVLATADAFHAMTEDRPHRPALEPGAASRELQTEIEAGRLDREAGAAVLEAAGQRPTRTRSTAPAGLSGREIEVLRLVARGRSNKQIAEALYISAATVHHHVLHVYQKTGVSSRAGAALFAMENDLLRGTAEGD